MADLAELNIRVNATAEGLESTLNAASQGIRRFAKEAESGIQVDVKMKTDSLKQASSAIRELFDSVKVINGDVMRQARDMAKSAGAETNAEIQSVIAAAQNGIQAMGDAGQKAGEQAEQSGKAVEQSAQQTQAALTDVGTSGQQAGEQVAQGGQKGADGLEKTTAAAKAADAALSGMGKLGLSVVQGIVGGITGGLTNAAVNWVLGGIEKWIDGLVVTQKELAELRKAHKAVMEEAYEAVQDEISDRKSLSDTYRDNASKIRAYADEYAKLRSTNNRTDSEESRFMQLQGELAELLGVTTEAIDVQSASLGAWKEAADKAANTNVGKALEETKKIIELSKKAAELKIGEAAYIKNHAIEDMSPLLETAKTEREFQYLMELQTQLLKAPREETQTAYREQLSAMFDVMLWDLENQGLKYSEAMAQTLKDYVVGSLTLGSDFFNDDSTASTEWIQAWMGNQISAAQDALLNSGALSESMEGFNGLVNSIFFGEREAGEAADELTGYLNDIQQASYEAFVQSGMSCEEANEKAIEFRNTLTGGVVDVKAFAQSVQESGEAQSEYGQTCAEADELVKGFNATLDDTTAAVNRLKTQKEAVNTVKKLNDILKSSTPNSKKYTDAMEQMPKACKEAGIAFDKAAYSAENMDKQIETAEAGVNASADAIVSGLTNTQSSLVSLRQGIIDASGGTIDVNTDPLIIAIDAAIKAVNGLLAILALAGIGPGAVDVPKKGGGGGGKKDDAEEAARAAEEARKEAIRRDYDMIDHKRHMNEITLEEELELLEAIRRNHQLNAEEIMDWEEKVYDLKKELRERDAESIDQLGDAVVDALEARYEAMRDAELERLDASREAWEKWRDDSVKAIEDQIDALDKLSETEDREKKDAEELRKIAKLRQQIEFEQDDYNRAKLQQQLEQALSSRADRLHKLALEDQKDALREQIEQIEQKADDEISAIDKEQDEIEKAYDERLKEAALRAEAEKLMMTQSQQQILDLLKEYAPDYDATGQTLGEKLLEGFQKKVGGIADWFKSFNAQMAKAQEQMAAMAQEAAGTFYRQQSERNQTQSAVPPTVVNQTVQFNEPVESPSQVARRIEQVNEELSVLLG